MPKLKKNTSPKPKAKASKVPAKKKAAPIKKRSLNSKEPTTKAQQPKAEEAYIIYEKSDRDKRIAIWSGVIFVMIIILIVWIQMTKQSINRAVEESKLNEQAESWENFSELLNERMDELTEDLDKIKEFGENVGEDNSISGGEPRELFPSTPATTTIATPTTEISEE